ncbi:MAG: metal-dependent hydrolase, partial [Kocuria sp.]|nr:metal-dependent hydrolase [Kocuria sp.]
GAGLIVVPLVAFAMKALGIRLGRRGSLLNTSLGPWIVSVGTAGLATYFLDFQWTWLPLAIGLGAFIHCLGDAMTIQGVPWLWPWNPAPPKKLLSLPVAGTVTKATWQRNGYFRLAMLGETTSVRETLFAGLVALYVIASLMLVTLTMV